MYTRSYMYTYGERERGDCQQHEPKSKPTIWNITLKTFKTVVYKELYANYFTFL